MGSRPNVLLITLDQFRGDCLSVMGHPVVRTPHLDRLAGDGTLLRRHYSQASPCSPGRAALYTGTYQMNNRVVFNGTPLDDRFDNVAKVARRAGYDPTMFGYTDQGVDPRTVTDPTDPRLSSYEGILPGFTTELDLSDGHLPWLAWLTENGVDTTGGGEVVLAQEPDRHEDLGISTFLTDRFVEWLGERDAPWFAHLSYLRPHPPYAAAGRWAKAYAADDVDLPIAPSADRHGFHDAVLGNEATAAPTDEGLLRHLRAQYYGMIGDVDDQIGRVRLALEAAGQWDDTLIVVTSDHGEQLGDHGLIQKVGYWEESYRILGIVRDPARPKGHGTEVDHFTENIDVLPTICDAIGTAIPLQCDGRPLSTFLDGETPASWRDAAHWEFDWRALFIPFGEFRWPADRVLEHQALAVRRSEDTAYVHFGNGTSLCFDLAADPTWRTAVTDPARILAQAQAMLTWRSEHLDRTLTGMLLQDGGIGRIPAR